MLDEDYAEPPWSSVFDTNQQSNPNVIYDDLLDTVRFDSVSRNVLIEANFLISDFD